jgi:lipopolysaccharide export system protein LptA
MKRLAAGLVVVAAVSAGALAHAASPAPTSPSTAARPAAQAAAAPSGPPNALQGFSQNRDKPIKISSASLEVRDKDKVATFSGDVHLIQGDTTLRSKTLVVFYDDDSAPKDAKDSAPAAKPVKPTPVAAGAADPPPMSQQIRRVEAKGGVLVTQKDQTATGESGVFDMQANTVTLLGNVVIAQGQNVVKGDRLTVDLTSGVSRVECGKTQGQCRVQALIQPGAAMKGDKPGTEAAPSQAPPHEAPRQRGPAAGLY